MAEFGEVTHTESKPSYARIMIWIMAAGGLLLLYAVTGVSVVLKASCFALLFWFLPGRRTMWSGEARKSAG